MFEVAARNLNGIDNLRRRLTPVREPFQRARALWGRNTPSSSRVDISKHYDLGNELFSLMLDETMMYSSGIFTRRDASLAEASVEKNRDLAERRRRHPLPGDGTHRRRDAP